jgi:DNA-binding XRE family transcriptional regulator
MHGVGTQSSPPGPGISYGLAQRACGPYRQVMLIKIGLLLKKAREDKNLTQEQLAELVDKKRTYISRVENNGSNLTLKTLYEIVEKGLGGKVKISIEI